MALSIATKMPPAGGERPMVGLIAGWGRYPIVVAEALRRSGYGVVCLGIREHADGEALSEICDHFRWFGVGRIGGAIRFLHRHGASEATMAGKFHKKMLFQPWVWFRHFPDWTSFQHFYPYFAGARWIGASRGRDRKDDTLLGAVVDLFAKHAITFGPATDYAPELLVKLGQLTTRGLTAAQRLDIEFGWDLAREMGRLDVGQSIVVKERAVLAVEAIEGTDECIRRAGALCGSGGFTVVKVAKPRQDMRFDVPTIGLRTLETLKKSGGRVLAIEAHKTILIDEKETLAYANRNKLVIVALDDPSSAEVAA